MVATLYDQTESVIGAGLATTTADISGWNDLLMYAQSPTGQTAFIGGVDDAGTGMQSQINWAAASFGLLQMNRFAGSGAAITAVTAAARVTGPFLDGRRMQWGLPTTGTVTKGRIRITVSR